MMPDLTIALAIGFVIGFIFDMAFARLFPIDAADAQDDDRTFFET